LNGSVFKSTIRLFSKHLDIALTITHTHWHMQTNEVKYQEKQRNSLSSM